MKLGASTRKPARALRAWESVQLLIALYNVRSNEVEALRDFLLKYAPHVFVEDAQPKHLEFNFGKPYRGYGTLAHFRASEGRDWFDSEYFHKLVDLRELLCELLDLYITKRLKGQHLTALQGLLRGFSPTFAIRDRKTDEIADIARFWDKPLDHANVEIIWGGLIETGGAIERYKLDIGEQLAQLVFGLYKIIQMGISVLRCQNRGCQNIFVPRPGAPSGPKSPKYCPQCRYKRKRK